MIYILNGKKFTTTVGGGNFSVIPSDKYTVQVTDVNPKVQFNSYKNVEEEGLNYEFTILDNKTVITKNEEGAEEPESLRGRKLWRYFSPSEEGVMSLGAKSNFRKFAEAALGKELTREEKAVFDPESLIGLQVDVFVEVVNGKGVNADREFSNIASFLKTTKQLMGFDPKEKPQETVVVNKTESVAADAAEDEPEFIKTLK